MYHLSYQLCFRLLFAACALFPSFIGRSLIFPRFLRFSCCFLSFSLPWACLFLFSKVELCIFVFAGGISIATNAFVCIFVFLCKRIQKWLEKCQEAARPLTMVVFRLVEVCLLLVTRWAYHACRSVLVDTNKIILFFFQKNDTLHSSFFVYFAKECAFN